jgi:hypothetical protein
MNTQKQTFGRKSLGRTMYVPDTLRGLDWDALCALARSAGPEGVALVDAQTAVRASATCTACAARATEARLRVWIARREVKL